MVRLHLWCRQATHEIVTWAVSSDLWGPARQGTSWEAEPTKKLTVCMNSWHSRATSSHGVPVALSRSKGLISPGCQNRSCSPITNTCFLFPQPLILLIPPRKGIRLSPHQWFHNTFCQHSPASLARWKEAKKFYIKSFLFFFYFVDSQRILFQKILSSSKN